MPQYLAFVWCQCVGHSPGVDGMIGGIIVDAEECFEAFGDPDSVESDLAGGGAHDQGMETRVDGEAIGKIFACPAEKDWPFVDVEQMDGFRLSFVTDERGDLGQVIRNGFPVYVKRDGVQQLIKFNRVEAHWGTPTQPV